MNKDIEDLVRKIVREELGQLLGEMRANVSYISSGDHKDLSWEGLDAWIVESARDNAKVLERMEDS